MKIIILIIIIIIILYIILFLVNKYLLINKEDEIDEIENFISLSSFSDLFDDESSNSSLNSNSGSNSINNMYLFVCCDSNASIQINGKYNKRTFTQSGYNTLGSYFLENILNNDQISINVTNSSGNGAVCVSYIWNKQLYIMDQNGYSNNANIIKYTINGTKVWSNKISSSINNILPWMKNWITINGSINLSFNIGDKQNTSSLSNDMIVFLSIDNSGTVKLNGTQVFSTNQQWNEIENFTIPNVNNGDKLTFDCINAGGPGGITLTYLWQGNIYAFPSTFEGLNSTINIINFTSTNTTSFIYCNVNPSCDNANGILMFNGPNWLRSCDGNCNFTINTTVSNNVKNSWIYNKTINNWYKTEKNNLIGKWSDIGINLNNYMTISFYIDLESVDSTRRNIFHLSNQNANCCEIGNIIPGLWLISNKLYLIINSTTVSNNIINVEIPTNKQSYITLIFNYNTIKIYLNGNIVSNKLYSDPLELAIPDAYFYISDPWSDGGVNIKDFTIYNYILSDNEVKYLYDNINDGLYYNKIDSEIINNTSFVSTNIKNSVTT